MPNKAQEVSPPRVNLGGSMPTAMLQSRCCAVLDRIPTAQHAVMAHVERCMRAPCPGCCSCRAACTAAARLVAQAPLPVCPCTGPPEERMIRHLLPRAAAAAAGSRPLAARRPAQQQPTHTCQPPGVCGVPCSRPGRSAAGAHLWHILTVFQALLLGSGLRRA